MFFDKNKFKISIVSKYILKEFLLTFLICFLFFFVMLFINFILVHIKELLQQNVPLYLIASLMITYFPTILIFSLPFATLLATLMVMGRLSSDNEIIAFRAHGISVFKLFKPIFFCGIIITLITFYVNDRLFPIAWHQRNVTLAKISRVKPNLNLKSKTIKKYDNKTIYTNIVDEDHVEGLIIIDAQGKEKKIITAKEADVITAKEKSSILELRMSGTMHQFENPDRPSEFNFGYSDSLSYFIDLQEIFDKSIKSNLAITKFTIDNYKDIKKYSVVNQNNNFKMDEEIIILKEKNKSNELNAVEFNYTNQNINNYHEEIKNIDKNISELKEKINNAKKKRIIPELNENLIEFFRKFTNPLACIIFAIFAAPIGIYSRKAGYQIGFIIGLFLAAFYWFFFMSTWTLGNRMILNPFIAMFLPNLFFLILGLLALFKRLKE